MLGISWKDKVRNEEVRKKIALPNLELTKRRGLRYDSGMSSGWTMVDCRNESVNAFSTWRLHVAWMYIWWVRRQAARKENLTLTLTLTLTHTITAYSVSGNVVRVRILICATGQKPCRKRVYLISHALAMYWEANSTKRRMGSKEKELDWRDKTRFKGQWPVLWGSINKSVALTEKTGVDVWPNVSSTRDELLRTKDAV